MIRSPHRESWRAALAKSFHSFGGRSNRLLSRSKRIQERPMPARVSANLYGGRSHARVEIGPRTKENLPSQQEPMDHSP